MISSFCHGLSTDTAGGDGHELIQHDELESEFEHVREVLDWMVQACLVEVDENNGNAVACDAYDVDVNEIPHNPALSDGRLGAEQL